MKLSYFCWMIVPQEREEGGGFFVLISLGLGGALPPACCSQSFALRQVLISVLTVLFFVIPTQPVCLAFGARALKCG